MPKTERCPAGRFSCQLEGLCRVAGTAPEDSWAALVRNLSPKGIALLLHRPVEPGTVLSLALFRPVAGPGCQLTVRVVHLKPQSRTEWLIGCELVTQLTEREVHELLEH
jgi:hypothetical protein